jgi:hypothetical protein
MSVIGVISLYLKGFLHDGPQAGVSVSVMLIVIGKMAYVRDFLAGVTVMTLMTMIYGLVLDRGCAATS